MDWSKYSALKSESKASMAKEEVKAAVLYEEGDEMPEGKSAGDEKEAAQEAVYLSQKRWNPDNGEAMDDDKSEMSMPALEAEKARYDAQAASAKAQSDGLASAMADYDKA